MIYVGKKVLVIDFSILDSKTYSFFINDELCEVRLERKDLKMYYHFEINKKADTPRNQARKKIARKHWRQSVGIFAGFALILVAVAVYFNVTLSKQNAQLDLLKNPSTTIGEIRIDKEKNPTTLSLLFIANSKNYTTTTHLKEFENSPAAPVLPLESGDEFVVEYAANNPKINKIRFEKPTAKQMEVYFDRVYKKHVAFNTDLSIKKAACELDIAYKMHGMDALADFYFQQTEPADNPKHNRNSYLRLIRDLPCTHERPKYSCLG